MASIFENSDAPCGVFGANAWQDTYATVSFVRGFRSQNSAGEIETIFRPALTVIGDLQPIPAGLDRELHGQVFKAMYNLIVTGTPAVQDGDRTYIRGAQMEITQIAQYGTQHCEIELGYLGR